MQESAKPVPKTASSVHFNWGDKCRHQLTVTQMAWITSHSVTLSGRKILWGVRPDLSPYAIHSIVTFQSFLCYLYWDHLSVLLVDDVFNLCDHWNFAFCYPSMKIYYILFGKKWVLSSHHVLMLQVLTLYFSSVWLISQRYQRWPGALYHGQGWVTECYRILPTWNNHRVTTAASPITTTVHQWYSNIPYQFLTMLLKSTE